MTAGCARCGECCSPVVLDADVYAGCCERARSGEGIHHNDRFITQYWHPQAAFTDETGTWLKLRCDAFDPESRECRAYDDRPPVCRDFPWYGGEPSPERGGYMYRQCSYLADLPPDQRPEDARPLIPLTVLAH